MTTQPLMGLVSRTLTDQDKVKEKKYFIHFFSTFDFIIETPDCCANYSVY